MANQRVTATGEGLTTLGFMDQLRYSIWRHQQNLRENPDPSDDWAFLIDPDAQVEKPCDW